MEIPGTGPCWASIALAGIMPGPGVVGHPERDQMDWCNHWPVNPHYRRPTRVLVWRPAALKKSSKRYALRARSYSDAGKSGLTLQCRSALRALLTDVESGNTDYSAVLVHDVSRWGRFQGVDESAFHEYRRKRANIVVHYRAEPFANDGSVSSACEQLTRNMKQGVS